MKKKIMKMNHFLSTSTATAFLLLLLTLTLTSVHSTSTSRTTKKYLQRTIEVMPKANKDIPDKINFQFSIQSSSPSGSQTQSQSVLAEALTSFGSTLFKASEEYGNRFISFGVEPLTTLDTDEGVPVAISKDGLTRRQLRSDEEEGQYSSSSSFEADLVLEKDTNTTVESTATEQVTSVSVTQFFLNGLNDAAAAESNGDLDNLLGEWIAVDFDYHDDDDTETSAASITTTTTSTTYAEEPPPQPPDDTNEETAAVDKSISAVQKTKTTLPSKSKTTSIKSNNGTNPGAINPKVIGIALSVFGICFLTFLYVAYGHHFNCKRKKEKVIVNTTPSGSGEWRKSTLSNSLIYVPNSKRNFSLEDLSLDDDDEVEDGLS